MPGSDRPLFDFRSQRFCTDALALVASTGRALALCRQELFIAEGDVEEARDALVAAACAGEGGPVWH